MRLGYTGQFLALDLHASSCRNLGTCRCSCPKLAPSTGTPQKPCPLATQETLNFSAAALGRRVTIGGTRLGGKNDCGTFTRFFLVSPSLFFLFFSSRCSTHHFIFLTPVSSSFSSFLLLLSLSSPSPSSIFLYLFVRTAYTITRYVGAPDITLGFRFTATR